MKKAVGSRTGVAVGCAVALASAAAPAHIEVVSGGATANASNEITFLVGHGCAGHDTFRVAMDVPAGVASVRVNRSDFGKPAVTKNGTDVTSATWEKPENLGDDYGSYKLTIRARMPDAPFTTVYFPFHQTCRDANGAEDTPVDWTALPGQSGEPAPGVKLYPARFPGWNKFTVPVAMTSDDLKAWFGDAQIVWKGDAAYSANPSTAALIASTQGVTALTSLAANDEIWVKY